MSEYTGEVNASQLLNSDWGLENAQWSGALIQEGIKDAINNKIGYSTVYKKFICNFKNILDYNTWVTEGCNIKDTYLLKSYSKIDYNSLINAASVIVSGTYANREISELGSADTVTTTADNAKIKNLKFTCFYEDDEGLTYELPNTVVITWNIDLGANTIISGTTVNDSVIDDIDLSAYLTSTSQSIRIWVSFYFSSDVAAIGNFNSKEKGLDKAFNVLLNDYDVSFSQLTFWTTPWIITSNLNVSVWLKGSTGTDNINLYVDFYLNGVLKKSYLTSKYEDNYQTSKIAPLPIKIHNNWLSDLGSGVFTIKIYFTYNNTQSNVISKNILLKSSESDATPYICANLENESFTNYTSVPICKYIVNGAIGTVTESLGNKSNEKTIESNSDTYTFSTLLNFDVPVGLDSMITTVSLIANNITYFLQNVTIDTRNKFSAVSGASVDIDPSGQNSNSNLINSVSNSEIHTVWNGMNWSDNDGFIQETINNIQINTLKILKESSVSIDTPLVSNENENFTFEILYKITNSTNDNDVVISSKNGNDTFAGLRITPTEIDFRPVSGQRNLNTILFVAPEELIHLTIVYNSNYSNWGSSLLNRNDFPLIKIYINGKIAREQFSTSGISTNNNPLSIGGIESDTAIYKIRKYDKALSDSLVLSNFYNCYNTNLEDRINSNTKNNSIYGNGGIDFNKIKNAGFPFNCFVLSSLKEYPEDLPNFLVAGDAPKCVLPGYTNNAQVKDALIELYWDKINFPGNHNLQIQLKEVKDGNNESTESYLLYLGSSSKDYYRWNWRSKFAKGCDITDLEPTEDLNMSGENCSFTMFTNLKDGVPTEGILVSVLTAKKNAASSMQSHKLGFVNAYNALYQQLAKNVDKTVTNKDGSTTLLLYSSLISPIMAKNSDSSIKNTRVSIWLAPFFGFIKIGDTYKFVGLYTLGPDKGDKKVSGFDNKVYPMFSEIEGANLDPRFTNFILPWNEKVIASTAKDAAKLINKEDTEKDTTAAWEIITSNLYYTGNIVKVLKTGEDLPSISNYKVGDTIYINDDYDISAKGSNSELVPQSTYTLTEENTWSKSKSVKFDKDNSSEHNKYLLIKEFKDAYKFIFNHGTNIIGIEGNVDLSKITSTNYYYNYWFSNDSNKYLYYYNGTEWTKAYHVEKVGSEYVNIPCSLYDGIDENTEIVWEIGMSIEDYNQAWIDARAIHARNHFSEYFNLVDTLNWFIDVELNAGTDERAKNIYPYKIGNVQYSKDSDGNYKFSKIIGENTWRWRIDDTDTRLDIDNEGLTTKKYYIEVGDSGNAGSWPRRSNLFNILDHDAFWSLKLDIFAKRLEAMAKLANKTNTIDGLVEFYLKYLWENTADYFTEMGYNEDAIFTYDQAKAQNIAGTTFNVDPISLSLGDHKLAERNFIKNRLKYLTTKYANGTIMLKDYLALGRNLSGDITITYDDWVYPTSYTGTSMLDDIKRENVRVSQGGSHTFLFRLEGSSSGGIGSKSSISSVGNNWGEITNTSTLPTEFTNMNKMKDLDLHNHTGLFTVAGLNNLLSLNITNCTAISSSAIDLGASTHLKTLKASGTKLDKLRVASGAPLTTAAYPSSLTELYLDKLLNLKSGGFNFSGWNSVNDIFIRNSDPSLNVLDNMFKAIKKGHNYDHVYITGISESWDSTTAPNNLNDLKTFASLGIKGYKKQSSDSVFFDPDNNTKATLSGDIYVLCHYFKNDLLTILNNFTGNLNIKTDGFYYALVQFNNKLFLELLYNYLLANSYNDDITSELSLMAATNPLYESYIVWNNLISHNNKIYNLLCSTPSNITTAGNTIISAPSNNKLGNNPDFTDWGTWFPNTIPGFLHNHTCSNISLDLVYTNLNPSVSIDALGTTENNSAYNFKSLNIDASGLNLYVKKGNFINSWTDVWNYIDTFRITAKKILFRNDYSNTPMDYNRWIVNNLYLNSSEVSLFYGANTTTGNFLEKYSVKNIYINLNLYWDYVFDSNFGKRLTDIDNCDSNYIPYDFLNNKIGELINYSLIVCSNTYMLLSKANFKLSSDTYSASMNAASKIFSIKFGYLIRGFVFGNQGFRLLITSNLKLNFTFLNMNGAYSSITSDTTLDPNILYSVECSNKTNSTILTLKDSEDNIIETKTIDDIVAEYSTPYAIGNYNSYSHSESDIESFTDRWELPKNTFVGFITNINLKRTSTNWEVIADSSSNSFQVTSSMNLPLIVTPDTDTKSCYYKVY